MSVLAAPTIPTNGTDAPQSVGVIITATAIAGIIVQTFPLIPAPVSTGAATDTHGYATTG